MKTKTITLIGLLFCLGLVVDGRTESAQSGQTTGTDLFFGPAEFNAGSHNGTAAGPDGLTLSPTAVTGQYLSPVIETPIPYSAVVPQWLADVPEGASLTLHLRTGTAGNRWSDWQQIVENDDWMLPGDSHIVGQMITVPAADQTHQKIQFAVAFSGYRGDIGQYDALSTPPLLQKLRLSLIDASQGPTAAELAARQAALDQQQPDANEGGYPKPPVISRAVWCTDPACNYNEGLAYAPVTHLILHHTVSNNTNSDWAAVVRSIWYYHTIVLGWGDIGYHYLADMNGNLYEGHLGGDDVIGIHAAGANTGSMGLALIGTFTAPHQDPPGIPPPPAMLNSAAELFAWKADQKNIDVYDAGYLPNVSWGLPYLMGHRDVDGSTLCPGDQAHVLLPWLRDEVAQRIGFISPHQYIDETSAAFTKSGGLWNIPPGGCGFAGHAYYAWSITNPNNGFQWGEWRPSVAFPGIYEIETYAPYCITGAPETEGAAYKITHAGGTSNVTVSHQANVGAWMSLGQYNLVSGTNTVIRLTNLTTTDNGRGVWFDAIRLRPIQITVATNQQPPAGSWQQQRNITFSWLLSNPTATSATRLEVAEDSDFNNLLLAVPLPPTITIYNHTFAQDYAQLYWRIVVTTTQNTNASSQPTSFGIDTIAPQSAVTAIYRIEDGPYTVHWTGSDATSGIAAYTIQYRPEGTTIWTTWLVDTTLTTAVFLPPDNQTYWFRSQATDQAGNVESPHGLPGDINTDQAILLSRAIMLPLVRKA